MMLELQCQSIRRVSKSPVPNVTMSSECHDVINIYMTQSNNLESRIKENIKHFTIRNLSVSDSGTYSCVSSLTTAQCLGSDVRTELRVRVKN